MTLKVGVIGCGVVGFHIHIPFLMKNPHTEVVCICDSDKVRLNDAAKKYNIPRSYVSAFELIEKEKLDLIHICTPPSSHLSISLRALEAGCNILVEKPFTLKLSEADIIIKKAESAGRRLTVVHNLLFTPQMETTIEKSQQLGALSFLSAIWGRKTDFTRSWLKDIPGGRLGENLPHALYCMLPFIENPSVMDVQALKLRDDSGGPFDEIHVTLKGKRTLASLSMTSNSQRPNTLILCGEKGSLATRFAEFQKMDILWSKNNAPPSDGSGHLGMFNKWVDSLINDSEPPVTPAQAREVVRVYELIWGKIV